MLLLWHSQYYLATMLVFILCIICTYELVLLLSYQSLVLASITSCAQYVHWITQIIHTFHYSTRIDFQGFFRILSSSIPDVGNFATTAHAPKQSTIRYAINSYHMHTCQYSCTRVCILQLVGLKLSTSSYKYSSLVLLLLLCMHA